MSSDDEPMHSPAPWSGSAEAGVRSGLASGLFLLDAAASALEPGRQASRMSSPVLAHSIGIFAQVAESQFSNLILSTSSLCKQA